MKRRPLVVSPSALHLRRSDRADVGAGHARRQGPYTRNYCYDDDLRCVWASRFVGFDEEEEGGYEYASYHPGAKPESEEAHVEPIALVQSLGETAEGSEGSGSEGGIGVVPLCKTDSEGGCARETGGGGRACPPRFAVCRNYKHRHEVSRREVERVAAEERKLGQDAGCTALGFGVGLAADPVAGAGVGFLCGLL